MCALVMVKHVGIKHAYPFHVNIRGCNFAGDNKQTAAQATFARANGALFADYKLHCHRDALD